MSKIKLLILLLISIFTFACSNNKVHNIDQKYSLAYIGGEFDGLLLKNYLISSLKNLNIYDQNSKLTIKTSIGHSSNLFVTNINNTSDREKIDTRLYVSVINQQYNCEIYNDDINVSQFYIYSSSDKFLSNQKALKQIKKDNTEAAVNNFINKLKKIDGECDE